MAEQKSKTILIADDDENSRNVIIRNLKRAGYTTVEACDGKEAQELMSDDITVALIDLRMPKANGMECLKFAKENFPQITTIMISGYGGVQDVIEAIKLGAFHYLEKPFDREELINLVDRACEMSNLSQENQTLRQAIAAPSLPVDIVADSKAMGELMEKVQKLASLDSTVLLTGESGTGKTTIARLIHQLSGQKGSFVSLNCASIPRDLLEAELFGHEKGAFTGAVNSRPGSIELADGGTLFLDEIGDMPMDIQPKLLTFLQDRSIKRLGSTKTRTFDVRIITATNRDLEEMCEEKDFREDLFFRINVLSLEIPALRDRQEDIEKLANNYLKKIADKRNCAAHSLSSAALLAMKNYFWPGNIRELENIIERASAFASSNIIEESDLALDNNSPSEKSSTKALDLSGLTMAEIEVKAIKDALRACEGNKANAAKMLGMSTKSIYNKISRYQIL